MIRKVKRSALWAFLLTLVLAPVALATAQFLGNSAAIAAYHAEVSGGKPSRWIYTPLGIVLFHLDDSAVSASTLEAYLLAF